MEATFPSSAVTRVVAVIGASSVAVTAFTIEFQDNPASLVWFVPFFGAYAAGGVAFRVPPGHLAARRLLAFGAVATIWIGATVGVAGFEAHGRQWWLGPANVAVQVLGLAWGRR